VKKNIIVIAPHPDDETLGCGGSLLKHQADGDIISWLIVTHMSLQNGYSQEKITAREKEIASVSKQYNFQDVINLKFQPTMLDTLPKTDLISALSQSFSKIKPNIVYFPFCNDIHSDHRVTSEAVLACSKTFRFPYLKTFRAYEVISETEFGNNLYHEAFHPNLWIDVSTYLEKKIEIMSIYESEIDQHPFPRSKKNIKNLASFRGSTIGVQYAESFISVKDII